MVERVDTGRRLVNVAGETMQDVVASVTCVTDITSEISLARQEQSSKSQIAE